MKSFRTIYELMSKFIKEANENTCINIEGHRIVDWEHEIDHQDLEQLQTFLMDIKSGKMMFTHLTAKEFGGKSHR